MGPDNTLWVNSADRAALGDSLVVVPQEDFPDTLVNAYWGLVVEVGPTKTYRVQLSGRYTPRAKVGTNDYGAECMAGYPALAEEGARIARAAWPELRRKIASLPPEETLKYLSDAALALADARIGRGIASGPATHQDRCIAVRYGYCSNSFIWPDDSRLDGRPTNDS